MKKKISIISVAVIFLVIVIVIGIYPYNSYQMKSEFRADIISYLENKGYDYKADIEELDLVCLSQKCDNYVAEVKFKDEHSVDYLYAYKVNSKQIEQIDVYSTAITRAPKHKEE